MIRPREFTYHGDELDLVPPDWPRRLPPRSLTLGDAMWAFSPGSSRYDTYKGWTSLKTNRAYIWWRNPDLPETFGVPAKFRPYASGPLTRSNREALRNALAFGWAKEAASECELSMPSEMNAGFLDSADFLFICKQIWLHEPDDDDARTSDEDLEVDVWAAKATWQDERWHGASGMHRQFHTALRRQAARTYAARHLSTHGRLPTGKVSVRYTYAPGGSSADLITPFGNSFGELNCDIVFPDCLPI